MPENKRNKQSDNAGISIKKTKKRGDVITLPDSQTTIYQSNRVTNGQYKGFSLIQSKLLVSLIGRLQGAIMAEMKGQDWQQLDLFENVDKSIIKVGIPLSDIGKHYQYKDIAAAAEGFTNMSIRVKPTSAEYHSIAALAAQVDLPVKENGKSVMYIHLLKRVAEQLVNIDKNIKGTPVHYTKYLYEVPLNAKNKYTFKFYWLISSWKAKGGFRISYKELRDHLGLDQNEYAEYKDFKRRILVPVQKDLEKKSDCWFNCDANGFEIRTGRRVSFLDFKIIVPEFEEAQNEKYDYIRNILKMHLSFDPMDLLKVEPLFKLNIAPDLIMGKITEVFGKIKDPENKIINHKSYMIRSLENEFLS